MPKLTEKMLKPTSPTQYDTYVTKTNIIHRQCIRKQAHTETCNSKTSGTS